MSTAVCCRCVAVVCVSEGVGTEGGSISCFDTFCSTAAWKRGDAI
jgi:hypothetical protein